MVKKTLLIGSGFSQSFGGYLPREVFQKILDVEGLTDSLREQTGKYENSCDFEQLIEDVQANIENKFTSIDQSIMRDCLLEIFTSMDKVFISNIQHDHPDFSYLQIMSFIMKNFSIDEENGSGYVFSLNQDLLLERLFSDYLRQKKFYLTGWAKFHYQGENIPHYGPINSPLYQYHPDDQKLPFDTLEAATQEAIDAWMKKGSSTYETRGQVKRPVPCLIKLHGSYYWRKDEKNAIWVVGKNKPDKIAKVPILRLYFDKFNQIVNNNDIELYVIGYGFSDEHINQIIFDGCEKGVRLIVFDVLSRDKWLMRMANQTQNRFNALWLKEYYAQPLPKLFKTTMKDRDILFNGSRAEGIETLRRINVDMQ